MRLLGPLVSPELLLLGLLVPLVWAVWLRQHRRAAIRFSGIDRLQRQKPTAAVRLRAVVPVLRTLALAAMVIAIARPRKGNEETRIVAEGIAVEMVVDTSTSMLAEDFAVGEDHKNRLDVVKQVFRGFVKGDETLPGRESDLIGMIAFARYADSKCPLTLDHENLLEALEKTQIVTARGEDGTAIGDAIALGVERLQNIKRRRQQTSRPEEVKSKVMIVLTDGENNAGEIAPTKAAEMASAFGIRIYTIGTGTKGEAPFPTRDFMGRRKLIPMRVNIDEETLTKVAQVTGGKYFRATDRNKLREIYEEIDALERSEIEEVRYMQYAEKAPPLLLLAFGLLGAEVLLVNTRFRKIP
jgi:Ca-activated chloride channel homolog